MRDRSLGLALAGLLFATVVPSALAGEVEATGVPDASVRIAEGRALAETLCQRCHAVGEDGASTHKDAPPFRDIANRYPVWSLAEALAEGIVTGHPDMPAFTFEPKQIGALLSYMDTLSPKED